MPNAKNNELTLKRYLIFNDAKELSSKLIMLLVDNDINIDNYLSNIMIGFLGEQNVNAKIVNMSSEVLTQYVNLLNKLVLIKNVNGKPTECLLPEGLEKDLVINKYRTIIRSTVENNQNCLNLPSIEKAPIKTILEWSKKVNSDINEFNKCANIDKFKATYLLTDYAINCFDTSVDNMCYDIETEAQDEKNKINFDKTIPGAQKALMIEDIARDRLNNKIFAPKKLAGEYLENVKQGINAKLQFTYKSTPTTKK